MPFWVFLQVLKEILVAQEVRVFLDLLDLKAKWETWDFQVLLITSNLILKALDAHDLRPGLCVATCL